MADKIDLAVARALSFHVMGNNGFYGTKNALDGTIDEDLRKTLVGKELTNALVMGLYNTEQAQRYGGWQFELFTKATAPGEGTVLAPGKYIVK